MNLMIRFLNRIRDINQRYNYPANLMTRLLNKIHEINQRYKYPKIHQSRAVKISLLMLRIYLLLLVVLLIYKFVTVIRGG
ncbi:MAG TPA: hypothetical protein VEG43_02980 [Dehalococcoidia bacterium]|nr:hypothetical protein [Dehalococcoidia bacterium]